MINLSPKTDYGWLAGDKNNWFIKSLNVNKKQTYIITNFNFWCKYGKEIATWCETNTINGINTLEHVTLCFANEQEELMFLLRWGGSKL